MQRLINRLAIALILVSCILIRPLRADAQEDKLDRAVPDKKFSNELMKNVLEELSRGGNFTFSYNSKLLKKKSLVTLTIRASTLRQALTDILGDGYSYVMMDNYLIITKNNDDVPAVKAKMAIKAKKSEIKEEDGSVKERFAIKQKDGSVKDSVAVIRFRKKKVGPMLDSLNLFEAKATMRAIIDDIVREGIVSDKESVTSFALYNFQFIVNGQSMSDSLRTKFASKYIRSSLGFGFYYGPVNVMGRGVFMNKSDLY